MDATAMPIWATRVRESVMTPVNITIAREGVEGYGSGKLHGRYGRHVRVGGRTAPGAHHRGLLGDVVRAVSHGGAHPGPAGRGVSGQVEGGQSRRGRQSEDGDALLRSLDSEYSILQGRAAREHAGGRVPEARLRAEDPAASVVASSPEDHAREHRSPDEFAGSPRGPDVPAGEPADPSDPPRLRPPRQPPRLWKARPRRPRGRLHHGLLAGGMFAAVLPQRRG